MTQAFRQFSTKFGEFAIFFTGAADRIVIKIQNILSEYNMRTNAAHTVEKLLSNESSFIFNQKIKLP